MSLGNQSLSAPEKEVATVPLLPPQVATAGPAGKAPQRAGAGRSGGAVGLCWLVLLAVLLGSAPVRNTDVWLHLATGRAVVQGTWRFGPDPFLHTAGNALVAHSWLSDVLLAELFEHFGAAGLIAWRCFLLAAMALVLLCAASGQRPSLLAGACVTVALLAVSVRVPLQPVCVSYLFLALTLWLLQRARQVAADGRPRAWLRAYGPLLLLFALWTNLDDWYLLGPFTVLLFLCGEAIGVARGRAGDLRGMLLLLAGSVLACLVSPWTVHGLTLPGELGLSGAAWELRHDGTLGKVFGSPLGQYLLTPQGLSVAGLAWLPLALLSLASFHGSSTAWTSWRLPVWLGFFALAIASARAVPFFAIVAGVVLALNLLDLRRRMSELARRASEGSGEAPRQPLIHWDALGAAFAVPVGLALVVFAWPGWLQEPPFGRRHWSIVVDPSLDKAKERLTALRQNGTLTTDSRGFNVSLEAANVLAWWAPEERSFLSSRGPAGAAAAFLEARHALFRPSDARRYQDVFRQHQIDHLILYDGDFERLATAFQYCMTNPHEWALLFLDGRMAIFGWRDPHHRAVQAGAPCLLAAQAQLVQSIGAGPVPYLLGAAEAASTAGALERFAATVDLDKQAFSPEGDKEAPDWAGRAPEVAYLWTNFVESAAPAATQADEAALYLRLFRSHAATGPSLRALIWDMAQVGNIVASQALPALPRACGLLLAGQVWEGGSPCRELYMLQHDDGPPGLLYQAVRAARRAIRASPNDARGYLELGRAYRYFLRGSRERAWYLRYPALEELRRAQLIAALRQAVLLDSKLLDAHEILADTYAHMGYLDWTLEHQREVVRLRREGHRRAADKADELEGLLTVAVRRLETLEQEAKHQKNTYLMNAENTRPLDRARRALNRGLAGEALQVLLSEKDVPGAAGQDGVEMELKLLFLSGRVDDLHNWMMPQLENLLGKERYHWWQAMLAIVSGDYTTADQHLVGSIAGLQAGFAVRDLRAAEGTPEAIRKRPEMPARTAFALDIGNAFFEALRNIQPRPFALDAILRRAYMVERVSLVDALLRHEADTEVLRGILALERGEIAAARAAFDRALSLWGSERALAEGGHIDFPARKPAQRMIDLIEGRP
jgi:hypothetical protein